MNTGTVKKERSVDDFVPNKTLLYIIPMLGHNFKQYGDSFYSSTIVIEEALIVITLYRDRISPDFEKVIMNRYNFVDIRFQNEMFISYSFRVPDTHIENFSYFVDGKYSKMDNEYKRFVLSCHIYNEQLYLKMKSTLFPTKEDRVYLMDSLGVNFLPGGDEAEVGSKIDLEKEEFNEENIK